MQGNPAAYRPTWPTAKNQPTNHLKYLHRTRAVNFTFFNDNTFYLIGNKYQPGLGIVAICLDVMNISAAPDRSQQWEEEGL